MANLPPRPHLPHRRMGLASLEGPAVTTKAINPGGQHEEHQGHEAVGFARTFFLSVLTVFVFLSFATVRSADAPPAVIVVVGAAGAKEYGEQFRGWAGRWETA